MRFRPRARRLLSLRSCTQFHFTVSNVAASSLRFLQRRDFFIEIYHSFHLVKLYLSSHLPNAPVLPPHFVNVMRKVALYSLADDALSPA